MIQARSLVKRFGEVVALDGLSLEIREGEFFSLLGPSGCGKTTLLRIIAGLEQPDTGKLEIGGVDVTRHAPQKRPVNTVFQNYALFPHLSVAGNVGFGLRMRGVASAELRERVGKAMDLVQIRPLADRAPGQLSGGQKQRVALARALVNEPKVLLLDEPLSALDARLRKELQQELKALQRRLGMTFVFVTHDQEEALALSDRIALMALAKLEQVGTPAELYEAPRTEFAAKFLGGCNILEGAIRDGKMITALGDLRVASEPGEAARFAIRPEHLTVFPAPSEINSVVMAVRGITYHGAQTELVLEKNGTELRVLAASHDLPALKTGESVPVAVPIEFLVPIKG